jgi:hypothetical protein
LRKEVHSAQAFAQSVTIAGSWACHVSLTSTNRSSAAASPAALETLRDRWRYRPVRALAERTLVRSRCTLPVGGVGVSV